MTLRLRIERFLLGLHGLALLRGWPYGDPTEADRRIAEMAELAARAVDESASEVVEVEDLDLAGAYATWASSYDAMPNALIELEEPVVRRLIERAPPGRVLDAACGTGRLTAALASNGRSVVGVDTSREMLAVAAEKAIGAAFARADLQLLPFADGTFELVVCNLALAHAADLTPPLAELARVLVPGGRLVVSDVHPVAVALGGHAAFVTDETRGVARNHVHWPSAYLEAFAAAGLLVEGLYEPLIDEVTVGLFSLERKRAIGDALLGLPFALVWDLRSAG